MFKCLLAAGLGLVATVANGQDIRDFYTVQPCAPLMQMIIETTALGEEPLFEGSSVQFHYTEQAVDGYMVFSVNQATGTWTMLTVYGDGMACMTASGENFQPYSGN